MRIPCNAGDIRDDSFRTRIDKDLGGLQGDRRILAAYLDRIFPCKRTYAQEDSHVGIMGKLFIILFAQKAYDGVFTLHRRTEVFLLFLPGNITARKVCRMHERLGWDTADIDAGAAVHLFGALDQGNLFAFLCQESR